MRVAPMRISRRALPKHEFLRSLDDRISATGAGNKRYSSVTGVAWHPCNGPRMRLTRAVLFALGAFAAQAAFATSVASGQQVDLTGIYNGTWTDGYESFGGAAILQIVQTGPSVSGTVTFPNGEPPHYNQNIDLHASFSGSLASFNISGIPEGEFGPVSAVCTPPPSSSATSMLAIGGSYDQLVAWCDAHDGTATYRTDVVELYFVIPKTVEILTGSGGGGDRKNKRRLSTPSRNVRFSAK